jgi:hypothetical protein
MWRREGMAHYTRYRSLTERLLQPLNRANAEELFLKLVDEKASDEKVRITGWMSDLGLTTPSSPRLP